jgi:acyl transferase domain-containing protein
MVERGTILPTYGVKDLTPKINWEGWKVEVPTDSRRFPNHLLVARVSINSFGYGGSNAHIIVESSRSLLAIPQSYKYNKPEKRARSKSIRGAANRNRPYLLTFSAHNAQTLKRNNQAHGKVIPNYSLLDLFTHSPIGAPTFPVVEWW